MSRRGQGQAAWYDRTGREVRASDTLTCAHCQRVSLTHDVAGKRIADDDLGGFCLRCMSQVCGPCADADACVPAEKKLELAERGVPEALGDRNLERAIARARARQSLFRALE